jgi:FMN phosphatase YigB (HAD superfamily)
MKSPNSSASSAASMAKLTDFEVLTFDCYGTLIDWESGMIEALKPLTSKASRPLKRDEILEAHARHESSQQIQTPTKLYRELLATVYRRLAEEWGVAASWTDCVAYGRSIRNWPAFADSASSLRYLKQPEAALQTRNTVERRQRELLLQQRKARGRFRCDLHRRGLRLLQALCPQFRVHAPQAQDARD